MFLKKLNLVNFRNYDNFFIELNPKINIIYGDNAQGKTNLLESIYFLALTKSHRSLNDASLIKNNCNFSKVSAICNINNIDSKYEIEINENRPKKLYIDNQFIKKISNYISKIKVIIFFPEDLDLIKLSPDVRRRYINIQISQLDNNYFLILNDFNKLLKIRNDLLKKELKGEYFDHDYFEIITKFFIEKSSYIYFARNKYINKINNYISNIFNKISNHGNLKIIYEYKIDNINLNEISYDEIKIILEKRFKYLEKYEKKSGSTLFGPQRDDYIFDINNNNIKLYGSQGQQRMAILALKLSEIELFKKINSDYPILLLDDVFSELDDNKKNNLLKYIDDNIQTIITTTDLNNLDPSIIDDSNLINIQNGKVINSRGE